MATARVSFGRCGQLGTLWSARWIAGSSLTCTALGHGHQCACDGKQRDGIGLENIVCDAKSTNNQSMIRCDRMRCMTIHVPVRV